MENNLAETMISMEKKMWEAFCSGDSQAFGALVLPDALMLVGGGRTSGEFYAQAISGLKIDSCHLEDFRVMHLSETSALVSYLASVKGGAGFEDLDGVYQVSSVWVRRGEAWKLIFNQDSAAVRRD